MDKILLISVDICWYVENSFKHSIFVECFAAYIRLVGGRIFVPNLKSTAFSGSFFK